MPVEETISPPLVFDPLSGEHKHTIILLHGRGKTARDFATGVLNSPIREIPSPDAISELEDDPSAPRRPPKTFRQCLPDARFVFPAARRQRATVYRRSIVRQWFDDWHLLGPAAATDVVGAWSYDEGLQTCGLGATVAHLHGLVAAEAALLAGDGDGDGGGDGGGGGARNVVLGGFSQGAAASLVAGLLWRGEREALGGVVGLCAWLPYRRQLGSVLSCGDAACRGEEDDDDDDDDEGVEEEEEEEDFCVYADVGADAFDPFERSSTPGREDCRGSGEGSVDEALEWLRQEIELPSTQLRSKAAAKHSRTPVMLCHGLEDAKVEPACSQEASKVMPRLGMGPVRWKTYPGVGHDFSDEMLSDVVGFLRQVCGGLES